MHALSLSTADGYCLFNLYEQWCAAFSYAPGRQDALPSILSAVRKLLSFRSDDTLMMYKLPEWERLVAMRGPAECVMRKRCAACACEHTEIGTSGFYDANALVCRSCGNVHFKSYYDASSTPACTCGSEFPETTAYGCPRCKSTKAVTVAESSPFEYFEAHAFTKGPGA